MKIRDQIKMHGILNTDQYQLTMAQLYFKHGYHDKQVCFEHFFRHYPDYQTSKAGYCINAGLEWFLSWLKELQFTPEDIAMLKTQKTDSGHFVFDQDFLRWLESVEIMEQLEMDAIPEGRVVHPGIPLTIIRGPLAILQILETPLLNQLNYQILVATKACRIKTAAREGMLLEFGSRRAQDLGVHAGIRAALIGGADFTSNIAASHLMGLQPKGTHSHAMVQFYIGMGMGEQEAFQAYADTYPDNCILLVDTINTLESGIPNAIKVFEKLRQKGHKPVGIRLDSGDLAHLSILAAKELNKAGFGEAKIVLSNELDEINIWQIITQIEEESRQYGVDPNALIKRLVYGVGTRLITSSGDPALSGVFKLTGIQHNGEWLPTTKISESLSKSIIPGNKKIWRIYSKSGKSTADVMSLNDETLSTGNDIKLYHPYDRDKSRMLLSKDLEKIEYLHETIFHKGELVYRFPDLDQIRKLRDNDLALLDSGVKRLIQPHIYHVSLSDKLHRLQQEVSNELLRLEN